MPRTSGKVSRPVSVRATALILKGGCLIGSLFAQAGRRSHPTGEGGLTINVVAYRENEAANPITPKC